MKNQKTLCPICGEGYLHEHIEQEEVEYNGHKSMTPLYYSECDACGCEQADATQTRNNKRAMIAFKKTVDGLLTGEELKALRIHLGINQNQAAAIFGGGPVAFSKYENDDVMQSEAMDRLLRLADEIPAAFDFLVKKSGVELIQTRQSIVSPVSVPSYQDESVEKWLEKNSRTRPRLRLIHSSPLPVTEQTRRYA